MLIGAFTNWVWKAMKRQSAARSPTLILLSAFMIIFRSSFPFGIINLKLHREIRWGQIRIVLHQSKDFLFLRKLRVFVDYDFHCVSTIVGRRIMWLVADHHHPRVCPLICFRVSSYAFPAAAAPAFECQYIFGTFQGVFNHPILTTLLSLLPNWFFNRKVSNSVFHSLLYKQSRRF